jgi:hypothetical protein
MGKLIQSLVVCLSLSVTIQSAAAPVCVDLNPNWNFDKLVRPDGVWEVSYPYYAMEVPKHPLDKPEYFYYLSPDQDSMTGFCSMLGMKYLSSNAVDPLRGQFDKIPYRFYRQIILNIDGTIKAAENRDWQKIVSVIYCK